MGNYNKDWVDYAGYYQIDPPPRYINANNLTKWFLDRRCSVYLQDGVDISGFSWDAIMDAIKEMPVADVKEEKHAKWIVTLWDISTVYAGSHRCSSCNGTATRDYISHEEVLSDFCPHCGAIMDL